MRCMPSCCLEVDRMCMGSLRKTLGSANLEANDKKDLQDQEKPNPEHLRPFWKEPLKQGPPSGIQLYIRAAMMCPSQLFLKPFLRGPIYVHVHYIEMQYLEESWVYCSLYSSAQGGPTCPQKFLVPYRPCRTLIQNLHEALTGPKCF